MPKYFPKKGPSHGDPDHHDFTSQTSSRSVHPFLSANARYTHTLYIHVGLLTSDSLSLRMPNYSHTTRV